MIHLYIGHGKGKSTAASGLAIRLLNYGRKILLITFLKNGQSGELIWLRQNSEIKHLYQEGWQGFIKDVGQQQFQKTKKAQMALLEYALQNKDDYDVIILDEFIDIISVKIIEIEEALATIKLLSDNREVIITGHQAIGAIIELADYYTEFVEHKHPFRKGVMARKGVEY